MARPKKIETEVLLEEVQKYHLQNPNYKIKFPELGAYLRKKGYSIGDYTLRRDAQIKKLVSEINSTKNYESDTTFVSVYEPLNTRTFLETNNTQHKLIDALTKRENYYARLADIAGKHIEKNKELKKEKEKLINENTDLTRQIEELKKYKIEVVELKKTIKSLSRFIEDSVTPDIANVILDKAGVFKTTSSIIDSDKVLNNIVAPDKTINNKSETSSLTVDDDPDNPVNDLLKGFD